MAARGIEAPEETGPLFEDGWWRQPFCPPDSRREGAPYPDGHWLGCRMLSAAYPNNLGGPLVTWHLGGQIASMSMHRRGVRIGAWFDWFENGCYDMIGTDDEQGRLHGIVMKFDENGALHVAARYEHGKSIETLYESR